MKIQNFLYLKPDIVVYHLNLDCFKFHLLNRSLILSLFLSFSLSLSLSLFLTLSLSLSLYIYIYVCVCVCVCICVCVCVWRNGLLLSNEKRKNIRFTEDKILLISTKKKFKHGVLKVDYIIADFKPVFLTEFKNHIHVSHQIKFLTYKHLLQMYRTSL